MATNLDLQEQEQLDQLKAFWNSYGNLITWVLTAVLAAFAGWNGWNWWQGQQSVKAAAMFDEMERAVQAGDADKSARVFADLKERYARTTFTQQAGLLAAKVQADKGQVDAAQASLGWVVDHGDDEIADIARLRIAAVLLDKKAYADALKQLDAVKLPEFAALAQDRRGDVMKAQGKTAEAVAAWKTAWDKMDAAQDYRRVVEAKLTAAAAAPAASAPASGVAP